MNQEQRCKKPIPHLSSDIYLSQSRKQSDPPSPRNNQDTHQPPEDIEQSSLPQRVPYLEDAAVLTSTEEIYQEHRRFLENYKKEREKQRTSQDYSPRNHHKRSYSTAARQPSSHTSSSNAEAVRQALAGIQQRLQGQILGQQFRNDRPAFKIFSEVVENKQDIPRVGKQRRFMRSQQSRGCQYREPAMPSRQKQPIQLRVKTQGIYDQVELGKQAKQFVQRIHKQQEYLLGKHLLRKKKEQGKRSNQQVQATKKSQQQAQARREQRKSRAAQNLMLLREKAKIAQAINLTNSRNSIFSTKHLLGLRGKLDQQSEPTTNQKKRNDLIYRYKQLTKGPSDRILQPSDAGIRERLAIRKKKALRTMQYHQQTEPQGKGKALITLPDVQNAQQFEGGDERNDFLAEEQENQLNYEKRTRTRSEDS